MNIEQLEELNILFNDKRLFDLLVNIEENKIDSILELFDFAGINTNELNKFFEKRSSVEQLKLINKLIEFGLSEILLSLIIDPDILKNRTCEEQLKLIDRYIKSMENTVVLDIIIDQDILNNILFDEQLILIDKYIEFKKFTQNEVTDIIEEKISWSTSKQDKIEKILFLKKLIYDLKKNSLKEFDEYTKILINRPVNN